MHAFNFTLKSHYILNIKVRLPSDTQALYLLLGINRADNSQSHTTLSSPPPISAKSM